MFKPLLLLIQLLNCAWCHIYPFSISLILHTVVRDPRAYPQELREQGRGQCGHTTDSLEMPNRPTAHVL